MTRGVFVKRFLHELDRIEERILAILLPFMCILIFVATFCRFTKLLSIPWSEELARYCMIWMVFLGISAGAKKGQHFNVSVIISAIPPLGRKVLAVIRTLLLIAFNVFVAWYGIVMMDNQIMMEQVTPTLKWPMWTMYLAIVIGSVLMAVRYTWHSYLELTGKLPEEEGGVVE